MPDTPTFEIPPELRDLAQKNIEQARAAYGQFMDFLAQAMGASSKASSEFRVIQDRAIQFARENADRSFSLGRELARAKDVQKVLTLQSQFIACPPHTRAAFARKADWFRLFARVGKKRQQAALIASEAKRKAQESPADPFWFWGLLDRDDGALWGSLQRARRYTSEVISRGA